MFSSYKRIIIFPTRLEDTDTFKVLLVEYYAPGCFKVLYQFTETKSYNHARNLSQHHARMAGVK